MVKLMAKAEDADKGILAGMLDQVKQLGIGHVKASTLGLEGK